MSQSYNNVNTFLHFLKNAHTVAKPFKKRLHEKMKKFYGFFAIHFQNNSIWET